LAGVRRSRSQLAEKVHGRTRRRNIDGVLLGWLWNSQHDARKAVNQHKQLLSVRGMLWNFMCIFSWESKTFIRPNKTL